MARRFSLSKGQRVYRKSKRGRPLVLPGIEDAIMVTIDNEQRACTDKQLARQFAI